MNIFSILGLIFIFSVVLGGIVTTLTPKEYHLFRDIPAILLVLGGTVGVAALTVQINRLGILVMTFLRRLIGGKRIHYKKVIKELMKISEAYRAGSSFLNLKTLTKDYFIQECFQLLEDDVVKEDELFDILEERITSMYALYSDEASRFRNLGKYPPAFGLMGTVLGMIALLSNLGGADAMKMIGPAMGTCLVATFFGIVTANVVVLPIGDSLAENAKEVRLKNRIIVEGIRLILQKKNPIYLAERLNSYVLPTDRLDWKEAIDSKG